PFAGQVAGCGNARSGRGAALRRNCQRFRNVSGRGEDARVSSGSHLAQAPEPGRNQAGMKGHEDKYMTEHDESQIRDALKQSFPSVKTELRRDLWPDVL